MPKKGCRLEYYHWTPPARRSTLHPEFTRLTARQAASEVRVGAGNMAALRREACAHGHAVFRQPYGGDKIVLKQKKR